MHPAQALYAQYAPGFQLAAGDTDAVPRQLAPRASRKNTRGPHFEQQSGCA